MIPLQQLIQQNAFAQDDDSVTDTEQSLGQKNTGSGESTNSNCAENMITSASDSIECIPSGPAAPTPPPPAIPFTISGGGSGTVTCLGGTDPATIVISAQGERVMDQQQGPSIGFFQVWEAECQLLAEPQMETHLV